MSRRADRRRSKWQRRFLREMRKAYRLYRQESYRAKNLEAFERRMALVWGGTEHRTYGR